MDKDLPPSVELSSDETHPDEVAEFAEQVAVGLKVPVRLLYGPEHPIHAFEAREKKKNKDLLIGILRDPVEGSNAKHLYTIEDCVQMLDWDAEAQLAVLMEFIGEKELVDEFNAYVTERYGQELEHE